MPAVQYIDTTRIRTNTGNATGAAQGNNATISPNVQGGIDSAQGNLNEFLGSVRGLQTNPYTEQDLAREGSRIRNTNDAAANRAVTNAFASQGPGGLSQLLSQTARGSAAANTSGQIGDMRLAARLADMENQYRKTGMLGTGAQLGQGLAGLGINAQGQANQYSLGLLQSQLDRLRIRQGDRALDLQENQSGIQNQLAMLDAANNTRNGLLPYMGTVVPGLSPLTRELNQGPLNPNLPGRRGPSLTV